MYESLNHGLLVTLELSKIRSINFVFILGFRFMKCFHFKSSILKLFLEEIIPNLGDGIKIKNFRIPAKVFSIIVFKELSVGANIQFICVLCSITIAHLLMLDMYKENSLGI